MNWMVLHESAIHAPLMMCDKHVQNQPREGVQMLVAACLLNGMPPESMPLTKTTKKPHKGGYKNHPATRWTSANMGNFAWSWMHTFGLCIEFKKRFGKEHFALGQLEHLATLPWEEYIPAGDMTPFARCFNQSQGENLDLLDEDKYTAVEAYRIYYMRDKASFAKWERGTPAPHWWKPQELTA